MKKFIFYLQVFTIVMACFIVQRAYGQITVGTGTSNSYIPISPCYDYTYSQQIYLASEVNASGTITDLAFYFSGSSLNVSNNWTVYIGTTSKTSFSSSSDWIPVSSMTQVYSTTFTSPTSSGWLNLNITDWFYNGTDNLVIAVDENAHGYNGSSDYFYSSPVSGNRTIYYCNDGTNPDPSSPPSGQTVAFIPNVMLYGIQGCTTPTNLLVSDLAATSAKFDWTSAGTKWNIEWGLHGFTKGTGTIVIGTTTKPYPISGLTENTGYDFYVQDFCGSSWAGPYYFTTPYKCPFPTALGATNITTTSADLSWTTGGATTWNIEWGAAGFTKGTGTTISGITTKPYTLSGLTQDAGYNFYVQDDCGGGDKSIWTGPYTFATLPTCPAPTSLIANNITQNSANLTWTTGGSALWNIEWGITGFTQGSGTIISGTTTNPHSLTGLLPGTNYSFYVQDDCGGGDESRWIGPYTFQTNLLSISGNVGIDNATLSYTDGTPKTVTSDGSSNYTILVSYNWSGTITPSKSGYSFIPSHKTYNSVTADITNENYTSDYSILVSGANASSNGGYSTLKSAFDAINAYSQTGNNVVITISGNTTETASAVLNAGTWTSLLIYPTNSGLSINGSLATPLIDLNGADNVIVDGRVNQTGAADLVISNTSTSSTAGTSTIRFINDATGNNIKYCNIKGSSLATSGGVLFFGTTSATTGNDGNTVEYNNITNAADANRPVNAICSDGTLEKENSENSISNNNVFDFFNRAIASFGVKLSYSIAWTIAGNSFYETGAFAPSATVNYAVIWINGSEGNNFTISGNYIGGSATNCGGRAWTKTNSNNNVFYGIYLALSHTSTASNVQGNTIKNISWTNSGSSSFYSIYAYTGIINIGTTTGNTIGEATGTSSLRFTNGSTGGSFYGIYIYTATTDVRNNTIASVRASNSNSQNATSCYGIYMASFPKKFTCINNTIGSLTEANSITINSGNPYPSSLIGIYSAGNSTNIVSDNTIANLTNHVISTTTSVYGRVHGIYLAKGTNTISNNTVRDLISWNSNNNAYNQASVVGITIDVAATATVQTVTNNTIYNLSNVFPGSTFAGSVIGIYYGGNTTPSTVSNNFIHSLSVYEDNTAGNIYGIKINSGATTYLHNLITLGGNTRTTVYGIYETGASGHNNNLYFNTVYINGNVSAGTNKSYALYSAANNTRIFFNNIFYNARSTVGGSSLHYALYDPSSGGTIDYNNCYVSGEGSVPYAYYARYKTDPQFDNAGGLNAADYKSNVTLTGIEISGITTDWEGTNRNNPPTIGIFENPCEIHEAASNITFGNISFNSINCKSWTAPLNTVYGYVMKINTENSFTAPLDGTNPTASTVYTGGEQVIFNGTTTYPNFTVTGLTLNTTYYFKVYAYKTCFGTIIYETTGTEASITTPIPILVTASQGTLSGSYYTLKDAFDKINDGTHQGIITIAISDNTTETATATLNASGSGLANYTSVLIESVVSGKSISGNLAAPLIELNGADNVTINGNDNLTITNTSTSSVAGTSTIRFINDACNNTINDCIIVGSSLATSGGIVFFSTAGTGEGNDNNTINSCNIEGFTDIPALQIISSIGTSAKENSGNNITGNQIKNIGSYGINLSSNNNDWNISSNTFRDTRPSTNDTFSPIYIDCPTGNNFNISGNTLYNFTYSNNNRTFYGIYLNVGSTTASNIQGNIIRNIYWAVSTNAPFYAIYINGGNVNIGTTTGNTIGAETGIESIKYYGSASGGNLYGIYVGAAVTDIQNNTIGSVSATYLNSINATNLYAIYKTGSGNFTCKNNVIGSNTTANSINATSGSDSNPQYVYGIYCIGSETNMIENNTINNLKNSTTNSTTTTYGRIQGIYTGSGINTIKGNTVANLTIQNANNVSDYNASIAGIVLNQTSGGLAHEVSGNTIYNLSNTNTSFTGSVIGLYYAGGTTQSIVLKNFVNGLSANASSSAANIYGFLINSGTTNYYHNIISIGGSTLTNIYGIYENGAANNNNNLYFNSVSLSGSVASGTNKSYALWSNASTNLRNIKDNIFCNTRSTTGGANLHYAAWFNYATNSNLTLDYNDYVASGIGGTLGYYASTNKTTLPIVTGLDGQSKNIEPQFINNNGTMVNDYKTNVALVGTAISGYEADFEGTTRNNPPTIGAFDYPCAIPSAQATNMTFGTVTDNTIQCTGWTAPINSVHGYVVKMNIANEFTSPETDYNPTANTAWQDDGEQVVYFGTAIPSNLVLTGMLDHTTYYFKIWAYNSCAGTKIYETTGLETNTTTPFVPIRIVATEGNTSGVYSTLKDAFGKINDGTHKGVIDIKFGISSVETATAVLNASGSGLASYTSISIYPLISGLSISGSLATPLIDLNGADNVTIDGRVNREGDANLIISNTSTSTTAGTSTIRFINDASNNIVRYCNIKGASKATDGGIVFFSTTTGTTGSDNNLIDNNIITNPDGTNRPINTIYSIGTSAKANSGNTIQFNSIYDFLSQSVASYGVHLSTNNSDWTVAGNSFYETTSFAPTAAVAYNVIYINDATGNNFTVSGNYIGGNTLGCNGMWTKTNAQNNLFYGIYLNVGSTTPSNIQGNTISNMSWTNSAASNFYIINVNAGNVNIGTVAGNNLGNTNESYTITCTNASTGSYFYGIYIGNAIADIRDNQLNYLSAANSVATNATSIYGIYKSGTGDFSCQSNVIYYLRALSTSTSYQQDVFGIYCSGSNTNNIIGNTISYASNATTNTTTSTFGKIQGIYTDNGINTITTNTVFLLTNNNANSASDHNCSVVGIVLNYTTAGKTHTISGNTIQFIRNNYSSFVGSVIGLYYSAGTTASIVSGNYIKDLTISSSSTAASFYGIKINAGNTTYSNNVISLENNYKTSIYGIYETGVASNNNNLYFNTVYLSGTLVSGATNPSYALWSNTTSNIRNFRNNIFYNARSTTGGSNLHYAAYFNYSSTTNLTVNYNDYLATGIGGVLGYFGANKTALPIVTSNDANSVNTNPTFVDVNGYTAQGFKSTQSISGTAIAGYENDFEGVLRNATPQMGAFEYTCAAPSSVSNIKLGTITHTSIQCTGWTAPTTLVTGYVVYVNNTDEFIAPDNGTSPTVNIAWQNAGQQAVYNSSSIPSNLTITGLTQSSMYYIKVYAYMTCSTVKLYETTGAATNVSTYITISGNAGVGSATMRYTDGTSKTVTADASGNYLVPIPQNWSGTITPSSSGCVFTPSSRTYSNVTASLTGENYTAVSAVNVSGANAASNGSFATLKAAFTAINAQSQTGNSIIVTITASTTETASAVLNAGTWNSLLIYPTVSELSISGNITTPLIDLNGADNVIIDGRVNQTGNADLTIVNTMASTQTGLSTIRFNNDASNNTIKYCNIKSSSLATDGGNILFGYTTLTTGNDDNTIEYNNLTNASETIRSVNTIYSYGSNSKENTGNTVRYNNFYNFFSKAYTSYGIQIKDYNSDWTISHNSFYETASFAPSSSSTYYAIYIYNGYTNFTISNNYIGGNAPMCTGTPFTKFGGSYSNPFYGIYAYVGSTTESNIQGNIIKNISWTNNGNASFNAIHCYQGKFNIGTTEGNTIGATEGTGSINFTNNATDGIFYGINTYYSTAVVKNNKIGAITVANNNTTYATNFYGINSNGTIDCQYNTIGSATTANSIDVTSAATASEQYVYGIYGSSDNTISHNLITNITNRTSNTTTSYYGRINGILCNGTNVISDNEISNLTNYNRNTRSDMYASVLGIAVNTTNNTTISGNNISELKNLYAGSGCSILGMFVQTETSSINTISSNKIYNLSASASSSHYIYGCHLEGGTLTFANNIISLGNDNYSSFYGLQISGSSGTHKIYFNTIRIIGTAANSNNSQALMSLSSSHIRDIRNNIFYNSRSSSGANWAVFYNYSVNTNLTVEYNDYVASGTGGKLGRYGTDKTTLPIVTGKDANSITTNPAFRYNYRPGVALNGAALAGWNVDYDGQTRGVPPTMGALEYLCYAPTEAATGLTFGTITNSTIQITGLTEPTNGADGYVIKVNSTNSFTTPIDGDDPFSNTVYTGGEQVVYNTYSLPTNLVVTGLAANTTYYFKVYSYRYCTQTKYETIGLEANAKTYIQIEGNTGGVSATLTYTEGTQKTVTSDASGNYLISVPEHWSGIITPTQTGQIFVPTNREYTDVTSEELNQDYVAYGNISVSGATFNGQFATLKAAFDNINLYSQTGNSIAITINNSTTETASAVLNEGTWSTLTIYPAVSGAKISGNITTPLIDLAGADRVTIDGRVNQTGNANLTIQNFNATATSYNSTIRFRDDACNNIIRYCTIKGASTATDGGIIYFGSATTTGNDNNTVEFNNITNANGNRPLNAIYSYNYYSNNSENLVQNNNIYDFFNLTTQSYGIYLSGGSNWTISGNSLYETAVFAPTSSVTYYAILLSYSYVATVTGNYIGGNAPNCVGTFTKENATNNPFTAIKIDADATLPSEVQGNIIKNIFWKSTQFYGLYLNSGKINVGTSAPNIIGEATGTGSISITGSFTGIINTNATAVIQNNIIGSITCDNTFYGIQSNGEVHGNTIGSTTTANSIQSAGTYFYGIYCNSNTTNNFTGNTVSNIKSTSSMMYGIFNGTGTNTIVNNTIRNLSNSGNISGIYINTSNSANLVNLISGNTISNLISTDNFFQGSQYGIYYIGLQQSLSTISNNFISDFSVPNVVLSVYKSSLYGIKIESGAHTCFNNIISLGGNPKSILYGIHETGASTNDNTLYFNTIYISGNGETGTSNKSYALWSNAVTNKRIFRNNIFVNTRSTTNGSNLHYAAYFNYSTTTNLTLSNNDYIASGTGGVLGYFGGNKTDVPIVTGMDNNSVNINPMFINAGGTIATDYKSTVPLTGAAISSYTSDYEGTTRLNPPSMGAFEYIPCAMPTEPAASITFGTISSNSILCTGWTAPTNGADGYVVKVNTSNSFTAPSNGDEPTANTLWQNAGEQVIYAGTSIPTNLLVSGLSDITTYYFKVFSYNDCNATETYETTGANANVLTHNDFYTISGNAGNAGVTLSYTDGEAKTATADGDGNYSFTVSYNWSGDVTPSKTGYTFTPTFAHFDNVTANRTQDFTATAITYTISGNAGNAGVTLSYTDGEAKTATADGDGNYSFTVSYNWSGDVTPSKTGYTFTPTLAHFDNVTANRTQDFTATAITYTISGNAGNAGVTLSYTDGEAKTATADGDGNYSFTVSYNWSGDVTPSKTGYTFTPTFAYFDNVTENEIQDFTSATSTYTISGNTGTPNAQIVYAEGTTEADVNGNYSFTVNYGWSGTVTPSKLGYMFNPINMSYAPIVENQSNQDYTAIPTSIWSGTAWNAGVPTSTVNAIISGNYTQNASFECKNLTINNGTTLYINPLYTVTVSGNIVNNGTIWLRSDLTTNPSGALINHGTISESGAYKAERNISQKTVAHYVSAPMPNQLNTVFGAYTSFKRYNSNYLWTNFTGTLELMRGYSTMYGVANKVVTFSGAPFNTGNLSWNTWKGANVVGNPYPSAVDWNAASGWTKSNIAASISFFSGTRYAVWNGTSGTNGATSIIPAMQAFMVNSTSAGSIAVNNNARVASTQAFWKVNNVVDNGLRLTVTGGEFDGDETIIKFNTDATENFDAEFDGYKLFEEEAGLAHLFTQTSASEPLAINYLPEVETLPLYFVCGVSGSYTISASEVNLSNNQTVMLQDVKTGIFTDLTTNNYQFNNVTNDSPNRFLLHFTNSTSANGVLSKKISIYSIQNTVYVNIGNQTQAQVEIFDLNGRKVVSETMKSSTATFMLPTQGIYLVKVTNEGKVETKRVFIQK